MWLNVTKPFATIMSSLASSHVVWKTIACALIRMQTLLLSYGLSCVTVPEDEYSMLTPQPVIQHHARPLCGKSAAGMSEHISEPISYPAFMAVSVSR